MQIVKYLIFAVAVTSAIQMDQSAKPEKIPKEDRVKIDKKTDLPREKKDKTAKAEKVKGEKPAKADKGQGKGKLECGPGEYVDKSIDGPKICVADGTPAPGCLLFWPGSVIADTLAGLCLTPTYEADGLTFLHSELVVGSGTFDGPIVFDTTQLCMEVKGKNRKDDQEYCQAFTQEEIDAFNLTLEVAGEVVGEAPA